MKNRCDKLQTVGAYILSAIETYQREQNSVQLLAVSKHHPATAIREVFACGQLAFGENYAQEMLEKAEQLSDLEIEWHFIGPLQSNKTRPIAAVADWVHAVDRLKIARRLSDQRPDDLPPLFICLQVNISEEESKSGVLPNEVLALAKQVATLPKIKLRGLMAIPKAEIDFNKQREIFAKLRGLQEELIKEGMQLDTLSMGMSADMPAAIAEGATIVRIGTAIFGTRI
ncbi:MAG TPA: YggS family pyridoxal phosphate-dependent enzyme [Leucothrix mucor]|uniref:Pyridoxal phosphate homeostasis protein n=1 Tax=Leucothrix mucor TaxID=45248 RepID=A0A7V2WUG8_LEUMU|nr:YggS family pyridoxal phosphate-dependent enzyme [Leucothrix mucor]